MNVSFFKTAPILCALFVLAGCKDDPEPVLSVNQYEIRFDASGGIGQLDVTSNLEWRISGIDDWLSISPSYGTGNQNVKLTTSENKDINKRTSTLTIQSIDGKLSQRVDITQAGATASLNVSTNNITLTSGGESKTFQITCNTNWTITGNPSWLTISPSTGKGNQNIVVTASENLETSPRNCTLVVCCDNGEKSTTIEIKQEAASTSLLVNGKSNTVLNFSKSADETQTVSITSNSNWSITNPVEWLRVSPTSGANNGTISITTTHINNSASEREAEITVLGSGIKAIIKVVQEQGLASGCRVEIGDITTLCNGIAFTVSPEENVQYYHVGYLEKDDAYSMTEAEIINVLETRFKRRDASKENDVIDFADGIMPNTTYYVYTIGIQDKGGNNGERGELVRTEITTPQKQNIEPSAMIIDLSMEDDYCWHWKTEKSPTCYTYYMLATSDYDLGNTSDVYQAWLIDEKIRKNEIEEYLNGGNWYSNWDMSYGTNYCFVWTRGVDNNKKKSGEIMWTGGSCEFYSSAKTLSKKGIARSNVEFHSLSDLKKCKVFKIAK